MQGGDGPTAPERNGGIHCSKHNTSSLNGVYEAPIDRLGPGGRWLRHKLLAGILAGAPAIVKFQSLRQPWLDQLMHVLSFMGTEDFYTPIIVLLAIVIDSRLAYLFTILMGLGFYLTTFLKNMFRLPRPPVPPVQALEVTFDWALPSLHALIGVALPWYLFIYIYQTYSLHSFAFLGLFFFVVIWSVSVCVSRVYLGVHSLADILCGIIPGFILLVSYLLLDDFLDLYLKQMPIVSIMLAIVFYIVALAVHPQSGPPTHSFGETVVTTSVALGMLFGYTRTLGSDRWFYTALMEQEEARSLSLFSMLWLSVTRLLIGTPLVFAMRVVVKRFMKEALFQFCHVLGIPAYSYSHYIRSCVQMNKHYTDNYQIPPIQEKYHKSGLENGKPNHSNGTTNGAMNGSTNGTLNGSVNGFTHTNGHHSVNSSSRVPFDVDIPIKSVTYFAMGWLVTEWVHHLFFTLGFTAHAS